MLILVWRSNQTNKWYPIGCLINSEDYKFYYIKGAKYAMQEAGFSPLKCFPDLNHVYHYDELFPFFGNRIMQKNRPEYSDYIKYLNLDENEEDPIAILARSSGRKQTDFFELFPKPKMNGDQLYLHFFARGISHLPHNSLEIIENLPKKESLKLCHDFQNSVDMNALMLRTDDKTSGRKNDLHIVGYLPGYLASELIHLIHEPDPYNDLRVNVERVNHGSPTQFLLLCSLTAKWKERLKPFTGEMYQPIVSKESLVTQ